MTVSKKTQKTIKVTVNIIFFVALSALALYYILKDNPQEAFKILGGANFFPLLLAIGTVVLTNILEGVSITLLARIYNHNYHYYQGLINAQIGAFIGCLNKTSANFIQAYTFTKQDVDGPNAASILTMNFLMYQFTLTFYSLVMIFVGYPFVKDIPLTLLGGIKIFPLSLIGFGIDAAFLIVIVLLAWCRPLHRFVVDFGVRFLAKLHIIKDPDATRKKWTLKFATYRIESKRLLSHKRIMLVLLFINIAKQFLSNILPYLCFWALGADLTSLSFLSCLGGTSYITLISSYLTMGAPEVAFQAIFYYLIANGSSVESVVSSANSLASAGNLIWRSLSLYFNIVVGGLTFALYKGSPKKYELLSNTATLYDLEVMNYNNSTDASTKEFVNNVKPKSSNEPLLSEAEIEESFDRIRRNMENSKAMVKDSSEEKKDLTMTLTIEKKRLAQALKESQALNGSESLDQEIQAESASEYSYSEQNEKRRVQRKKKKQAIKKAKKAEKEKIRLQKMQPYGTTIKVDKEKGLDFEGPEIDEERTITTSDPEDSDLSEDNTMDSAVIKSVFKESKKGKK
mgnify:FL=1